MPSSWLKRVVNEARAACLSFAAYKRQFFDFRRRPGYRGWENWLTVEIGRRLNTRSVLTFAPYHGVKNGRRLDLLVDSCNPKVAVEIKVNYLDDDEIRSWVPGDAGLPVRVLRDRNKLEGLPVEFSRLLLVSTCFDSHPGLIKYKGVVDRTLPIDFPGWRAEWYDCSNTKLEGWTLLLALSRRRA